MRHWKVGVKVYVLLALALVMMAVVGITGIASMKGMEQDEKSLYEEKLVSLSLIDQMRINNRAIESYLFEMMLNNDPKLTEMLKSNIAARVERNNNALAQYDAMPLDEQERPQIEKYKALLPQYRESRNQVQEMALANRDQEAYELFQNKVSDLREEMNTLLIEIGTDIDKDAKNAYQSSSDHGKAASIRMFTVMGAALLLLGGMGWAITRMVTRPVKQIQSLMERAEQGDLTVQGTYESRDELGALARSFNGMMGGIRELVQKVNESSLSLSASSEELTASSDQTARASEHIASATGEMAIGFEEQVKSVNEISDSLEAMKENLTVMAHNGDEVIGVSSQAADLVHSGLKAMESVARQMNEIENSARDTRSIIQELSAQSEEIGTIVTAINEIASQTNLLALNASIEAARAGEAGRGFSIVASEIRKLADATGRSSGQIAEIVGRVQVEVNQAAASMEQGTERVQRGKVRTGQAAEAFASIEQAVASVAGKVAEVGEAIRAAEAESKRIVAAMHQIGSISEQGAASIEETSASSQEQLATMEEVAASAKGLAVMAQDLQAMLQQFKL